MSYTTNTQGSDSNCATTFLGTLSGIITAVSGWSLVETWTSGNETAKIWKSAAAQNGGVDFYVVAYAATAGATSITFAICEAYDAVNHKLQKYAPASGSGITVSTTDNTVTNATGVLPDSATAYQSPVTINSSGFTYWVSASAKRIVVATRVGTSDYGVFAGMCDNLLSTTDFPYSSVCLGVGYTGGNTSLTNNASASATYFSMTREPGAPAAATGNFASVLLSATTDYALWPILLGISSYDWPYKPGILGGRRAIYSSRNASYQYIPRALLPVDIITVPRLTTAVNGDTISYGGKTYVRMCRGTTDGLLFVDNSV
jgi:hypothetical protein